MRILHTIGPAAPATLVDAVLSAARWQAGRECQVVLAAPRLDPIAEAARAAQITVTPIELDSRLGAREAAQLRAAVRRHAIEVIHAHDELTSLQALMCADLCPVVRSFDKAGAARLAETAERALPFDHIVVEAVALRDRLVKAELAERAHVTVAAGSLDARMARLLEAYERAIVRSITGRLIPARFVGGQPVLRRVAPLAAE